VGFFFVVVVSCCVAQAVLELTFSCLSLLSAELVDHRSTNSGFKALSFNIGWCGAAEPFWRGCIFRLLGMKI
jgi:hypothetical protein